MKWEIDQRKYASGEVLFIGPWRVGGAHYDGTTAKTAKDKYRATCDLPGIGGLGLYETRELAKQRVEKAVRSWLDKLPPNVGLGVSR